MISAVIVRKDHMVQYQLSCSMHELTIISYYMYAMYYCHVDSVGYVYINLALLLFMLYRNVE